MSVEVAEQPEPLIGQILANRYQIESRLGEGAMGAVYRARHVKVGRAFAVKVLHPRLLEDHKVALRFEREAELAGRLRHPNVIGVVDVGETPDGLRYMVMDFAAGDDLAAHLVEAPMPPARIIHLVRQLLEGLYHAHEAGLIHRDFKPENVIVEKDMHGAEVPRIVDFGIAILREGGGSTDGEGRLTTNGLVLGTPHYMAPEQAVADPIDHRIDLFALGIVIYEMLCGKLPFDGSGAEVARANLLLDPPAISVRVPYLEVDPLLEAFARRLMAKNREHRPATAKAARELLDLVDRDRPAAAAALGVPPEQSTRTPAGTQPQTPQPRHAAHGNETFPPPIQAAPRASQLEAPPIATEGMPAPMGTARGIETTMTDPLPLEERRARGKRGWIVGGVGVLVAGGIAVFAMRGGESETRDRESARSSESGSASASAAASGQTPTPTRTPTPSGTDDEAVGTKPTGTDVTATKTPEGNQPSLGGSQNGGSQNGGNQTGGNQPGGTQLTGNQPGGKQTEIKQPGTKQPGGKLPAGKQPEIKQPGGSAPGGKQPDGKQPEIKQPGGSAPGGKQPDGKQPEIKQPETKQPETKQPEIKQPDAPVQSEAAAIAARYAAVGRKLAGLGPAANELWPRYRMININGVMSNADKRAEAAAILGKLERDIAAIGK